MQVEFFQERQIALCSLLRAFQAALACTVRSIPQVEIWFRLRNRKFPFVSLDPVKFPEVDIKCIYLFSPPSPPDYLPTSTMYTGYTSMYTTDVVSTTKRSSPNKITRECAEYMRLLFSKATTSIGTGYYAKHGSRRRPVRAAKETNRGTEGFQFYMHDAWVDMRLSWGCHARLGDITPCLEWLLSK